VAEAIGLYECAWPRLWVRRGAERVGGRACGSCALGGPPLGRCRPRTRRKPYPASFGDIAIQSERTFRQGPPAAPAAQCEDATPEYEAVLAFNRNAVPALMGLAICKFLTRSEDEAIPFTEHAIGLSPRAPHIGSVV
jgi:hypothetical protein